MTDIYAVSVGQIQQVSNSNFWPLDDVEIDNCEGTSCSTKPNFDAAMGG